MTWRQNLGFNLNVIEKQKGKCRSQSLNTDYCLLGLSLRWTVVPHVVQSPTLITVSLVYHWDEQWFLMLYSHPYWLLSPWFITEMNSSSSCCTITHTDYCLLGLSLSEQWSLMLYSHPHWLLSSWFITEMNSGSSYCTITHIDYCLLGLSLRWTLIPHVVQSPTLITVSLVYHWDEQWFLILYIHPHWLLSVGLSLRWTVVPHIVQSPTLITVSLVYHWNEQ